MTVGDWLRTRSPEPPPALAARMAAVLGLSLHEPVQSVTDVCLAAGERLAAALIRDETMSRASALDLLTADALVTYAFEAAGDRASDINDLAGNAMGRIAAVTHEARA